VVAITKPAIESEHFKVTLGKHRALRNVQFEGCVPPADGSLPTRERLALLMNLRDAISRTKPDYVLVPSADGPTLAMGILGHAGITLLPKGIPSEATLHYGYGPAAVTVRHFLKETAYRVAYSGCSWTHLNFVNFLFFEHALAQRWRWTERIRLVPDLVDGIITRTADNGLACRRSREPMLRGRAERQRNVLIVACAYRHAAAPFHYSISEFTTNIR
jgi:hypothetical protein